MPDDKARARDVLKRIKGSETSDGAGVRLRRYIASPELDMLDPFLLLDVFRSDDPDDYIAGFPPHPHRGFETVTYLLHGCMRHRDSAGHEGVIKAGGVQWMSAGRGIEHSEMPEQEQGLLYGFQLWVNLPAAKKMSPPRYQELEPDQIPFQMDANGIEIRVVAGTTNQGTEGAVTGIEAAPIYFDISVPAGETFQQQITPGHNALIYIIDGDLVVQGNKESSTATKELLLVLTDGDRLEVKATTWCRFILIAGKPFNEAVARYGPFVMNTEDEIRQACDDYNKGMFGRI